MIQQVERLKEIINQNSMGHLPLPYRVDLMKQISDICIVQKVLCECCKKVCSCFPKEYDTENPLYSVLSEIDSYLYKNKGTAESISVSGERLCNYAEQSIESCEDMAGWAIIALGYAIRNDAASILEIEDYNGEDDNAFDFESWNADFICSIAYSGSNPFMEIGNAEKRKEYWLWYLDMVLSMCEKSNTPYTMIKPTSKKSQNQISIPKRTQSWQIENVSNQIQQLVHALIEATDKQTKDWNKIVLSYTFISASYMNITCCREEEVQKITLCQSIENLIHNSLFHIHKDMYLQAPKEGAWMQCCITIEKGNSYDISFNYDDITSISDIFNNPDWLIGAFEDYPRSKEYTPQWLRKIIERRKLYLT